MCAALFSQNCRPGEALTDRILTVREGVVWLIFFQLFLKENEWTAFLFCFWLGILWRKWFLRQFSFFSWVYFFRLWPSKTGIKSPPTSPITFRWETGSFRLPAWKKKMAALSVEKGPLFKVILLGEAGVGKTSIFYRAKENSFLQQRKNTVGIDSFSMYIKVGDQQVTVSEVSVCTAIQ